MGRDKVENVGTLNAQIVTIKGEELKGVGARQTFCEFESSPISQNRDGSVASGADGDENLVMFGNGEIMEQHIIGTQTIILPTIAVGGANVGLDQTDNEGAEYGFGITAQSKSAFVVGTDKFYSKLKLSVAVVAGTDDCAFGFRKAEAYRAAIDDYDESTVLNVISGDIYIENILNNAATDATDTTDNLADATTITLGVYVDIDGKCYYTIDGAAPTTLPGTQMVFDDAEVVVPFFYHLNANASQAGAIIVQEWETGLWV